LIDQSRTDLGIAYSFLMAQTSPAPAAIPGSDPTELGGKTLYRGIYVSAVPVKIQQGDLTLDAQGDPNSVWIFQLGNTLTTGATGGNIILAHGAQAKNVYWQVGSAATINYGGGGTMVGTIISQAGLTISSPGQSTSSTVTTLNGRALALAASVTMVNTVINVPAP
jgi:hypothetical protein